MGGDEVKKRTLVYAMHPKERVMPEECKPPIPDINLIRKLAREVGYAIGVHGSQKRDFDLIAAPWIESAVDATTLVKHLCNRLNALVIGDYAYKPLGRVAVIIQIDGWFKHIDLSICPKEENIYNNNSIIPSADQYNRIENLRDAAQIFTDMINRRCPNGDEKTEALKHLAKTVSLIEKSILINEVSVPEQ